MPRYLQAVEHVRAGLALRERSEVIASGHPLRDLPQFGPGEQLHQFGLPDQDDLEELGARRFEIRQEPQLLEDADAQVLRLVDDQDGAPAALVRIEQVAIQRGAQRLEARGAFRVRHA